MIKTLIDNIISKFKPEPSYVFAVREELDDIAIEFHQALHARNQALHFFNYAIGKEMVEIAVYNLKAAESRLNLIAKDAKDIQRYHI